MTKTRIYRDLQVYNVSSKGTTRSQIATGGLVVIHLGPSSFFRTVEISRELSANQTRLAHVHVQSSHMYVWPSGGRSMAKIGDYVRTYSATRARRYNSSRAKPKDLIRRTLALYRVRVHCSPSLWARSIWLIRIRKTCSDL